MTFQVGSYVAFTSKFGDRVTGTFEGTTTAPQLVDGEVREVEMGLVRSFNAFGEETCVATNCLVPLDKLEQVP